MREVIRRLLAGDVPAAKPKARRKPKALPPARRNARVCAGGCGRTLFNGTNAECRPCRAFTKRARNQLDCAAYYRRVHGQKQAFCSAADVDAIFFAARTPPVERRWDLVFGPVYE
jgi:hypothetical protein